jgi:hypothetical protein
MSRDIGYEKLIVKYSLNSKDILVITESILKNKSLSFLQSELNGRLTKQKLYVVAKSICRDLVGESLELVASEMVKERKLMANTSVNASNTLPKKDDQEFNSSEDILDELIDLFYE